MIRGRRFFSRASTWGTALALAAFWGCATPPAYQQTPKDDWQVISFDGSKIGHMQRRRTEQNGRVVTESWMRLKLQQPGTGISDSETHLRYEESRHGAPLSIRKSVTTDSASAQMRAQVKDHLLTVHQSKGGPSQAFDLPLDFLLPEGRRLALLGQQGNRRELIYSDWSFSEMRFARYQISAQRIAPSVESQEADRPVWRLQRRRLDDKFAPVTTLHSDAQFFVLDEYSQSAGKAFAMEHCDQACAVADFTPQTHVYRHLIRSPYRITENALAGTIRYQMSGPANFRPPSTSEQTVTPIAGGWQIQVCEDCGQEPPLEAAAAERYLQASYWLTPADPGLAALAAPYRAGNYSVETVMIRLSRQVTRHMSEVADYAGYANAAEAWANGTGDCTEHALILASLGRAAGIPTRIAMGLAYNNDRFLGRRFVFVPHMWVQAWTGTRWQSFDSALGDFNAGYITLNLSQGEAAALIEMNAKLHQLKIISAVQVRERAGGHNGEQPLATSFRHRNPGDITWLSRQPL